MNTLWLTLIVTTILAFISQSVDYKFDESLTTQRVYHSVKAKTYFSLIVIILVFVAGCRYYVGSDFRAYYHYYDSYISSVEESIRTLNEPVLKIIYSIVIKFWHDGWACILSAAAITLTLELRYLYINTDRIAFSTILFVLLVFTSCFNAVRQTLAVAVCCSGFPYLRERRFKPFLIICILAFLCHRSSIIYLPIYFIVHRKITLKDIVLIAVGCILILRSYDVVFNLVGSVKDEMINLNDIYWTSGVRTISTIVAIIPYPFFLIMLKTKQISEEDSFYLNLLLVHGIISIVTMSSAALARTKMYTDPFLVISIPELCKRINPGNRKVVCVLIVILYTIVWWYTSKDIEWLWIWQRTHAV